jgi:hypothetical protein
MSRCRRRALSRPTLPPSHPISLPPLACSRHVQSTACNTCPASCRRAVLSATSQWQRAWTRERAASYRRRCSPAPPAGCSGTGTQYSRSCSTPACWCSERRTARTCCASSPSAVQVRCRRRCRPLLCLLLLVASVVSASSSNASVAAAAAASAATAASAVASAACGAGVMALRVTRTVCSSAAYRVRGLHCGLGLCLPRSLRHRARDVTPHRADVQ